MLARSMAAVPTRVRRIVIVLALAGVLPVMTATAAAVAADSDPATTAKRVGKLESEMRAVQRKVFPGGDAKFFTPDISSAPAAATAEPQGTPASAPINDLTARVDALERQLRTLTGQVEENQNSLKQLDTTLTKLRGDTEFRLTKLEGGTPAANAAGGSGSVAATASGGSAAGANPPATDSLATSGGAAANGSATTGSSASDAGTAATAAKPAGAAAASEPGKAGKPATKPATGKTGAKPATGDPVETVWRAAYAHYTAKDYDAAESGFADFLAANPKSSHASTAQYLLGRSYAAQSSSAQAAKAFLDGYQKYPKSEQAPDSLIGLGNALTALKKPDQACRALNELQSVYGAKLTAAQKAQAAKARTAAKCEA